MENQFQVFENEQFGKIRVVVINGVVWFVAADVCRALELTNPTVAVSRLDADERAKFNLGSTGTPFEHDVNCVNEPGLYRLIFASRKKEAKDFQRWVFHEVLPAIRETGSYSLPKVEKAVTVENQPMLKSTIAAIALNDAASIKKTMEENFGVKPGIAGATAISMVERLNGVDLSEVKGLLPAAEHEIGLYTPTQIAKKFGLKSAQVVNKKLVEFGLQEKDENGNYILTEKGKNYGEAMPFNNDKSGHSGYQIKWSAAVFSFFEKLIAA